MAKLTLIALLVSATVLTTVPRSAEAATYETHDMLLGFPVDRSGFHFQIVFGIGGGPDSAGLFHAMEIGGTLSNGTTIALLHTFIQNKGMLGGNHGGPDLFGGWLLEVKTPVGYPEIVAKLALGWGGIHDQSDGIRAISGITWAYGFDFHVPAWTDHGPTVAVHAIQSYLLDGTDRHYFGVGAGVGWTLF